MRRVCDKGGGVFLKKKNTHNKAVATRCDHSRSDLRPSKDCDTKVKPPESHFLPPSVCLFFINALQPPDFQWLSRDLR